MNELTFEDEVNLEPVDVPRAALRFAKEIAYPDLDVRAYLNRLEGLAEAASRVLTPIGTIREQAEILADFLFDQAGFQGNSGDYNDPRNSYLNEVFDRKLGIPISLSVIYVAVAQRLELPAYGVGLPGHYIVGVNDPQGRLYLDPFHGGQRLSVEDCANLVQMTAGSGESFRMEWLDPFPPRETLTRMLNNLRNVYLKAQAWDRGAAVVERLRILQPDLPDYLRDLGVFYHQAGSLRQAIEYYQEYLRRAPAASDAEGVKRSLQNAVQSLARLN